MKKEKEVAKVANKGEDFIKSRVKEIDRKDGKVAAITLENGWAIEFPLGGNPKYVLEGDTVHINYAKDSGAEKGDPNLMITRLGQGLCNPVIWHAKHSASLIVRQ